jgi:hypothetical protein
MNNFNLILAAIRRQCTLVNVPYNDCIEEVRSELDSTHHEHLDFYLSFLQDLGLIKYQTTDRTIILTELGKKTERLAA